MSLKDPAWIALIVAIISPIVTTWLNNMYQLKRLNIEHEHTLDDENRSRKETVYSRFLQNVGGVIYLRKYENLSDCGKSFSEIYLYTPKSMWPSLDQLQMLILSKEFDQAADLLSSISKELSHLIGAIQQ